MNTRQIRLALFLTVVVPVCAFAQTTPSTSTTAAATVTASQPATGASYDMASYKKLAQEALSKTGNLSDAFAKMKEVEHSWDSGTKAMKKAERKVWKPIDSQIDASLDACDSGKGGSSAKATTEIQKFISMLDTVH